MELIRFGEENTDPTTNIKFKSLRILSGLLSLIGWILIVVGIIVTFKLFQESSGFSLFIGLDIAFGGITSLAFGELIMLFIAIEKTHVRKQNSLNDI